MGFWQWLFTTIFGGAGPKEETSVCGGGADTATTTSQADPLARLTAANSIIQPMFQGPSRLSHNGEIVRIRFADGGTEDYAFAAASGTVVTVPGSLNVGNGIAKPC